MSRKTFNRECRVLCFEVVNGYLRNVGNHKKINKSIHNLTTQGYTIINFSINILVFFLHYSNVDLKYFYNNIFKI